MSYPERKNYRIIKKAKAYLKRSLIFDAIVVLGAINIFGSCASLFISLPYFFISLAASVTVIAICYKISVYCEEKAYLLMSGLTTQEPAVKRRRSNIIRVDFRKKRVYPDNRCSGM
ncbi:MAG: hypothetical protein ACI4FO_00165 [Acutalibacteraceae bacterium]